MLDKKNLINTGLVAAAAINFTSAAFANPPSTDPRYEELKKIMLKYVQKVVLYECVEQPGFNFDAYTWDEYEIKGLEVVLFDILNHTSNYCRPPELIGMHSAMFHQSED